MSIRSLRISFVGLIVFAASAWAAPTALEGTVKDPAGQPLKGADVRVEAKGGSNFSKTVKTDVKGQYVCNVLTAAKYRVTLLVNGAVKASINNATTKLGESTKLNFDLKAGTGAKTKATHMVYMPSETGSNLGGRWVEVDDTTGKASTAGADNVIKGGAGMLKGMQSNSGGMGNSTGGGQ
ncbi:MAG TPA: carboxypeptidase-like regulatory domain-containing protein [Chthoniobacterales bacterium]|nr:carboxypeptidase-like regulatory domain-containing protein [Chthoniobacterales bacterium]